MTPFEGDTYLAKDFATIVQHFKPTLLIETGTHLGNTTKYLVTFSLPVMAIEKNPEFIEITRKNVGIAPNLQLIQGDSPTVLEANFEYLKDKKILAFLDAHWGGGFILERELDFIAKLPIKPFLIIHDFYNPIHPEYGFDSHDDHPYTYEFYESRIKTIYGDNFKYQYNNYPDSNNHQGTIFINPIK